MKPLKSLSNRVKELLAEKFTFQTHDFSPESSTIINEELHAYAHSDY